MYNYSGLDKILKENNIKKSDLTKILRETCYSGQDFIKKLLDLFEISY